MSVAGFQYDLFRDVKVLPSPARCGVSKIFNCAAKSLYAVREVAQPYVAVETEKPSNPYIFGVPVINSQWLARSRCSSTYSTSARLPLKKCDISFFRHFILFKQGTASGSRTTDGSPVRFLVSAGVVAPLCPKLSAVEILVSLLGPIICLLAFRTLIVILSSLAVALLALRSYSVLPALSGVKGREGFEFLTFGANFLYIRRGHELKDSPFSLWSGSRGAIPSGHFSF